MNKIICEFNKEDVLIVAKAVTENPLRYVDKDLDSYWYCEFCNSKLEEYFGNPDDFIHDINCPVLIAQDILTRT